MRFPIPLSPPHPPPMRVGLALPPPLFPMNQKKPLLDIRGEKKTFWKPSNLKSANPCGSQIRNFV